jgi:putative ABC transport system substrate-binding protein
VRDLVSREPRVFLAFGDAALAAARQATTTIPIVGLTDDMVGGGHVASMAHPEGNTTGVSIQAGELDAKRLELLHQLVPAAHRVGALADPTTPWTRHTVETAARQLGLDLDFAVVQTAAEAFTEIRRMAAGGVGALNLCSSASLYAARAQIAELVAQLRLPTMYLAPEAAEEGGLAGYGPPFAACYRQQVELAVKILKGAKPADLPVQQPVKFNLVINMKTARALGLTVPQSLLALADEVIQ